MTWLALCAELRARDFSEPKRLGSLKKFGIVHASFGDNRDFILVSLESRTIRQVAT